MAEAQADNPLVEVVRAQQRQRWQHGDRVLVETLLQQHPDLAGDPERVLELVYQEVLLREERGETPHVAEYRQRFEQLSSRLEALFEVHRVLGPQPAGRLVATVEVAATRPRPAPPGEPPAPRERIAMALAPGPGPELSGEIQALLHRRLRIVALLLACGGSFRLVYEFLGFGRDAMTVFLGDIPAAFHFAVLAFVVAGAGSLACLLWRRHPLSLARLQMIELVLAAALLIGAGIRFWELFRLWLTQLSRLGEGGSLFFLGLIDMVSLVWAAALVGYGAFIPGTWRRRVVTVPLLALAPLCYVTFFGLQSEAFPRDLLARALPRMAVWLAIGTTVSLFAFRRVDALRREAFRARQLGQYRLKDRLGAGGMGEVYLAEHVLLRRPCALKLIRAEAAGDPRTLQRFEREVQATATLTNWHTVEIFDYGLAADGTFYYVMEYLPGLDLEQLVARHGPLPPERAVHLLRQVCSALREAHAVGLIHRDIKPSNVLVCERGGLFDVAKLLDFGLVRTPDLGQDTTRLTQEGSIAGTPAYLSPEQANGQASLDARTDIYSLGGVAYFLLAGRPPFQGSTVLQTLAAHLYESVVPLRERRADMPADLEAVVLRCLEKDPARRFADVASLDDALARCGCCGQWTQEKAAAWWRQHG